MRTLRSTLVLVALALALTVQVAGAATPLALLLVQRSDLRPGYSKPVGPGYVHMPQLPDGTPLGPQLLTRHGYILSYAVQFTDYGARPRRRVVDTRITESLDKYRTTSGAHWEYTRMVNARYPQSLSMAFPRIGDESSAFSAVVSQTPDKEIDIFFRSKRYVVRLALASASVKKNSALALARLVNGRIRVEG